MKEPKDRWLFKWQERRLDRELMALWLRAAEEGEDGLLEAELAVMRRYGQHWKAARWAEYVDPYAAGWADG